MAKFNIDVELDCLGEDENLDEALREEIMSSLKNHVTAKATESINKEIGKFLSEKCDSIEQMFTEKVETFLGNTFAERIEKMQIPYKEDSWKSEVKYMSMSEFVGTKYEEFLNRKVYDANGNRPDYSRDAKLSINEYLIGQYLGKELSTKVSAMIQKARKDAEETIVKTLKANLRDQLSADIINRLNIPALLINLQEKAALLEGKEAIA